MTPTPEQQAIIDAASLTEASILVNALAGAAKTTTLVMIANALAAKNPGVPILALAFNSRIKEEMERRLPSSVTCLTLNGLGHRAWMRHVRKSIRLDTKKGYEILKSVIRDGKYDLDRDQFTQMLDLISSCKVVGMVPSECDNYGPVRLVTDSDESWLRLTTEADIPFSPTTVKIAKAALIESIRQAFEGVIDFDDQIYMSVCFNASYTKYKIVLVDEAQDLSPINHRQVIKAVLQPPEGRVIVVGDRHQSIYAFRGADPMSIDKLGEMFDCVELELSTTFRCDIAICDVVRKHVPHIKHRDGAGQGEVKKLNEFSVHDLIRGSAILCRNNAPLITLASKALSLGIGVRILGKEVGKGLIRVLKKLNQELSGQDAVTAIEQYFANEMATALNAKNMPKVKRLEDQKDCLVGLSATNPGLSVSALASLVDAMFSDKAAMLTFATGHKSKGLEFPVVYHLNSFILANTRAEGDALVQEQNLEYVINTRAKNSLIFITLDGCEELNERE